MASAHWDTFYTPTNDLMPEHIDQNDKKEVKWPRLYIQSHPHTHTNVETVFVLTHATEIASQASFF